MTRALLIMLGLIAFSSAVGFTLARVLGWLSRRERSVADFNKMEMEFLALAQVNAGGGASRSLTQLSDTINQGEQQ